MKQNVHTYGNWKWANTIVGFSKGKPTKNQWEIDILVKFFND